VRIESNHIRLILSYRIGLHDEPPSPVETAELLGRGARPKAVHVDGRKKHRGVNRERLLSARRRVESLKVARHEVAVMLLEVLEDARILDLQEKFARSVLTTQGPVMQGAFC
jgi:hypothetical protein